MWMGLNATCRLIFFSGNLKELRPHLWEIGQKIGSTGCEFIVFKCSYSVLAFFLGAYIWYEWTNLGLEIGLNGLGLNGLGLNQR